MKSGRSQPKWDLTKQDSPSTPTKAQHNQALLCTLSDAATTKTQPLVNCSSLVWVRLLAKGKGVGKERLPGSGRGRKHHRMRKSYKSVTMTEPGCRAETLSSCQLSGVVRKQQQQQCTSPAQQTHILANSVRWISHKSSCALHIPPHTGQYHFIRTSTVVQYVNTG
jgi:hypothetical protein